MREILTEYIRIKAERWKLYLMLLAVVLAIASLAAIFVGIVTVGIWLPVLMERTAGLGFETFVFMILVPGAWFLWRVSDIRKAYNRISEKRSIDSHLNSGKD